MRRRKWTGRLAVGLLMVIAMTGAALATGNQGSQSDPLVTLSYLDEKAVPEIMEQVDQKIQQRADALSEEFQKKSAFVTVEVEKGKTITLSAGSQILLRSGVASCTDGLIDVTDGTTLGGALTANHLYIATGDGQKVTVSEKAIVMVLGNYTVN